jgi:aryl-alcohol dehydrogenase-like predicted oxidoreductase
MPIRGKATPEGTRHYAMRFPELMQARHFRDLRGLTVSSIGLGTYLGDEDDRTDRRYIDSVTLALKSGCNVIDSAINYRSQRSERNIGQALRSLMAPGTVPEGGDTQAPAIRREEIVIATKGGFIPFDGSRPRDAGGYFRETFIDSGIAKPEDVVAGCHVMTPGYIRDQIARSLANLGVETIDIYYLHNPETQLSEVPRPEFLKRLRAVFEALEREADLGRIQYYGTATWDGYRNAAGTPEHLSLDEVASAAKDAGGDANRFRVIQLPYNLAMPEAFTRACQPIDGHAMTPLAAAAKLGLYAMGSASILQGRLSSGLPPDIANGLAGLETDAQRALQFVRSTPGLGTALVGMKTAAHVRENLAVARKAPLHNQEVRSLFKKAD